MAGTSGSGTTGGGRAGGEEGGGAGFAPDNVQRLMEAGLLDQSILNSESDAVALIQGLDKQEVDALISVKEKLGFTGTLRCGGGPRGIF